MENHLQGEYVSVYVPTTPNPTSGFFLMMPKADTIELDMTVDAALKYIVSMGVVAPETLPRRMDPPDGTPHTEDRSPANLPRAPSNPNALPDAGGAVSAP